MKLDIEAIKARVAAATAGPWSWEGSIYEHMEAEIVAKRGLAQLWKSDNVIPDAAFIAHARTDIPDLIAALEAAERERDALKEAGTGLDALLEEIETVIKTVASRQSAYQAIIDGRAIWRHALEAKP